MTQRGSKYCFASASGGTNTSFSGMYPPSTALAMVSAGNAVPPKPPPAAGGGAGKYPPLAANPVVGAAAGSSAADGP